MTTTGHRTRRVVVSTFVSLDGVMQAPGAADEDGDGGFGHGGWQMPYVDAGAMAAIEQGFERAEGMLLGRRTYDIFAAHWPHQPGDDPIAARLNALDKYVVSDSITEPSWAGTTVIRRADMVRRVGELRRAPGVDLLVIGSGRLVAALRAESLVDEYRLMIHPLVLGAGKRLFGTDGDRLDLRLISWTATPSGVIVATYEPARRA